SHSQFLDREIVSRLNQLLPTSLQFDLCAQSVDFRGRAGLHLVRRLIVERLRGLYLCLGGGDASFVSDRLQVGVTNCENNEIARIFVGVFRGFQALRGGSRRVDGFPIEKRLRYAGASIEIGKGRGAWKIDAGDSKVQAYFAEIDLRGVNV